MAGNWIPYYLDLPRKPEVAIITRMTGLRRREVVAILLEFWGWASEHTADGLLVGMTVDDLATVIPDTTPKFWQAMATARAGRDKDPWIVQTEDGVLVSNPDRCGVTRGGKARLNKNRRQAQWRSGKDGPVDAPVDALGDVVEPPESSEGDGAASTDPPPTVTVTVTEESLRKRLPVNVTGSRGKQPKRKDGPVDAPVDALEVETRVQSIVQITEEPGNRSMYRRLVRCLPWDQVVGRSLAETMTAKLERTIRKTAGAMFIDGCKRYAEEQDVEWPFGKAEAAA